MKRNAMDANGTVKLLGQEYARYLLRNPQLLENAEGCYREQGMQRHAAAIVFLSQCSDRGIDPLS